MNYNVLLLVVGASLLGAALYPLRKKKMPISLPAIYLAVGFVLPFILPNMPNVNPLTYGPFAERLTELAVIISLVSAGLKIDRVEGWKRWNSTWRLLGITMPLCIAALALTGYWLLGLPLAVAVLLGAVMAPTDPVLASAVQVGPAGGGHEHEVHFTLTSEAGLNDSLAFPFVNLALVLAATGLTMSGITHWITVDVLWKLSAGLVMGLLIGWISAGLAQKQKSAATEGFVAIALTLISYGATELVHGYGFLAVFVAARAFRHSQGDDSYYRDLHGFSEQIEKLLMTILMILLGASISQGLLSDISWRVVALAGIFLIVIRPASGLIGLAGARITFTHKAIISFFGIRGIGSFYYLAYALNHSAIDETYGSLLWSAAALMVVISVVLHGFTVSFAMDRL